MMDCSKCFWMRIPHEGIHCYMFREKTRGNFCGQFREAAENKQESRPIPPVDRANDSVRVA